MSIEDYAYMLRDSVRIRAFRRAIEKAVKPGDVVLEIGAGLGTYGYFACLAGAARVYAIEGSVGEYCDSLARRQGFGDRFRVLKGMSSEVSLPERADLIIFEDFDSALIGAHLAPVVRDATRRFLAPGGRWLPFAASVHMALVEAPETWAEMAQWRERPEYLKGLEFEPLSRWLLNQPQKHRIPSESLMSPPRQIRRYEFGDPEEMFGLEAQGRETASRDGCVHGICSWFRLELEEGISLDNAPGEGETVFEQMFFPLSDALGVSEGEVLEWSLQCLVAKGGEEAWWKWQVASGGMAAEGSTFSAFPLTQEHLLRQSEDYVPPPPPNHHVMKRILEIVDEGLTQGEIATKILADFPREFSSKSDAMGFVVQVLEDGR